MKFYFLLFSCISVALALAAPGVLEVPYIYVQEKADIYESIQKCQKYMKEPTNLHRLPVSSLLA